MTKHKYLALVASLVICGGVMLWLAESSGAPRMQEARAPLPKVQQPEGQPDGREGVDTRQDEAQTESNANRGEVLAIESSKWGPPPARVSEIMKTYGEDLSDYERFMEVQELYAGAVSSSLALQLSQSFPQDEVEIAGASMASRLLSSSGQEFSSPKEDVEGQVNQLAIEFLSALRGQMEAHSKRFMGPSSDIATASSLTARTERFQKGIEQYKSLDGQVSFLFASYENAFQSVLGPPKQGNTYLDLSKLSNKRVSAPK